MSVSLFTILIVRKWETGGVRILFDVCNFYTLSTVESLYEERERERRHARFGHVSHTALSVSTETRPTCCSFCVRE